MPSSWKAALLETLWAQRRYYVAYNQYPRPVAQQFRFALAVPILAQTLQNACWMSRGNVPVFTNLLRRLCVVDKTKAYFMVRTQSPNVAFIDPESSLYNNTARRPCRVGPRPPVWAQPVPSQLAGVSHFPAFLGAACSAGFRGERGLVPGLLPNHCQRHGRREHGHGRRAGGSHALSPETLNIYTCTSVVYTRPPRYPGVVHWSGCTTNGYQSTATSTALLSAVVNRNVHVSCAKKDPVSGYDHCQL